jgi:hypothetical protein
MSIFYEQLSKGVGHSDEQVLTYCYNRNPELFVLGYGDYYSLITNYHYPVRDFGSIKRYFLEKALAVGKINLARNAAKKIYESYEKKLLSLTSDDVIYIRSIIDRYPENNIFYFSVKDTDIIDIKHIEKLKEISECNITVITNNCLKDYEIKNNPFHEAFEYLSDFHKINYLKVYFMHFYGGGFAMDKSISGSWIEAFNELNINKKIYINGYNENSSDDIYVVYLKKYWKFLVGNNGYIVRSNSDFTKMCYNQINNILNNKLNQLKLNIKDKLNKYPIEHNEMLGSIFHIAQFDFISNIGYSIPKPI